MSKKSRERRARAKFEQELKDRIAQHTFNWEVAEGPLFVPNLALEEEFPVKDERDFVNSVSKGESNPALDEKLISDNPSRFCELTKEGIHRWHTFRSKER